MKCDMFNPLPKKYNNNNSEICESCYSDYHTTLKFVNSLLKKSPRLDRFKTTFKKINNLTNAKNE